MHRFCFSSRLAVLHLIFAAPLSGGIGADQAADPGGQLAMANCRVRRCENPTHWRGLGKSGPVAQAIRGDASRGWGSRRSLRAAIGTVVQVGTEALGLVARGTRIVSGVDGSFQEPHEALPATGLLRVCHATTVPEQAAVTEAAFDGDWYRAGDVAQINDDGWITILG